MGSTVIPIADIEKGVSVKEKKKIQLSFEPIICFIREKTSDKEEMRKLIHSIKVGVALVLVSLLYFLDSLYEKVGDDNNAMWAIMTVVVIFEFYAGATLGKGLNRGLGTILGGGLGFLTATLAQEVGGIGRSIIVGISMLIFGGIATYCRMRRRIKIRYDYGVMIFILTFSLVAISGLRVDEVTEIARERLLMIVLGFVICIFTSLFIFPIWASDDLHLSTISKFHSLATSIQGCLEEYFRVENSEKEEQFASFTACKSVLSSKSKDESLANFARWEPWHGKFGLTYPWEKYLKIGEILREVAATTLSLKPCLQSPKQPMQSWRQSMREPCKAMGASLAWILKELGESMSKMRKCNAEELILPKLKSVRLELSELLSPSKLGQLQNGDGLATASLVFLLMDMEEKLEILTKEVQQLGEVACFSET